MGALNNAFEGSGAERVDFAAVKAASLRSIESLVRNWLPNGRRQGDEWSAINPTRGDKRAGSFNINLKTGAWGDFAVGDTGGDMIDLYRYLNGGDLLEAAKAVGDLLGVAPARSAQVHTLPIPRRMGAVLTPSESLKEPPLFPARTEPDADGKPRFIQAGVEGPRKFGDEIRRHFYKIGHTVVRVKIIRSGGNRAINWYRVVDGEASGWQSGKPEGFKAMPYVGDLDAFDAPPFAPDQATKPLWWPEGERDVDTVRSKGGLAFTFGGTGDGLPAGCEEYVRDRDVIILEDNDGGGIEHAEKKALLAAPVAKSVRIVKFRELSEKADVTDYFNGGATFADLQQRAAAVQAFELPSGPATNGEFKGDNPPRIVPTSYMWIAPESIPKRDFVYGRHLIRKFVSATVAPGGVGKSSLIATEVLAMVSGIDLLGVQPNGRSRCWLWNLEDPHEEIARHIQATAMHFNLKPRDVEGYLWVDSGRDQRLVTATNGRDGVVILEPVIDNLVEVLIERQIDVLSVDPFVSSHEASENDNPAMDRIVKAWGRVAHRANCAIELVHHTRKASAGETETSVDSSRGGKALTDGCRSVRVLNRMTQQEAENAGVENNRLHFRTFIDKGNLAPPAEKSDWFKLVSIDLGNGTNGGYGDSVGVVTPWQWPDLMADVSVNDLRAVQAIISKGNYRASVQAADWVGNAVAEACRLDLNKPTDKRKATNLLNIWKASGALKTESRKDEAGRDRPFIVVGEWAT